MPLTELRKIASPASRHLRIFRKLYLCSEFLRAIDPRVNDDEILPSVAEPGEVIFRDARLIAKELRLSGQYSPRASIAELSRHVLERSVTDLSDEYAVVEITTEDVLHAITRKLDYLSRPHPVTTRRNQDLLLNIELRNCRFLSAGQQAALSVFQVQGWRSVSVIIDRLVIVLFAGERAPRWMQLQQGKPRPRRLS
ncbi:hypothetical protein Q4485_00675 [Granulosicoccaceae sp. 1_MG-2023]|nr:hypothetical protein [Granulosicoccaceae sp. 1_MG-2023]